MFEQAPALVQDPIIPLMRDFRADTRDNKLNLGIGVYIDDQGITPVFGAVKQAEDRILREQQSKNYVTSTGEPAFLKHAAELMLPGLTLGENLLGMQTVGGSGAVRLVLECLARIGGQRKLWLTTPTWTNHRGIGAACGYEIGIFRYVDADMKIDLDALFEDLSQAQAGDVILMHLCCHNPTGTDLDEEQLQKVFGLIREKGLFPVVDAAYVGFGDELSNDVAKFQRYIDAFPELCLAISFSKNFGIYRERTGAAFVVGQDKAALNRTLDNMLAIARANYSTSPDHGARIVATVLQDPELRQAWSAELDAIRNRIRNTRRQLAARLTQIAQDRNWDYVATGTGMFAMLPISPEGVQKMRDEDALYIMPSGRLNLAGIPDSRLDEVAASLGRAMRV